jgi:hypothetical protein
VRQDVDIDVPPFVARVEATRRFIPKREVAVKYMLLIHGEQGRRGPTTESERDEVRERYGKIAAQMQEHGHLIEADELAEAASSTIVRVRDGSTVVTDGPFTETREQLGGYFLVSCDRDTALRYAAAMPGAGSGAIEVRSVAGHDGVE